METKETLFIQSETDYDKSCMKIYNHIICLNTV